MNNVLSDVNDLKDLIISSSEYIEYKNNVNRLEKNNEIKKLINKIKKLQKEVVRLEISNNNKEVEEKRLSELFDKLNSYDEYKKYISSSKKLNKLISKVQNNFEKYFNSLVS